MPETEFERQVRNLINKGYPGIAGLSDDEFRKQLEPLQERLPHLEYIEAGSPHSSIPFVIVIRNDWVDSEKAIQLVQRQGKSGFSVLDLDDINRFKPIEDIRLPSGSAYLIVDIDTGRETLNATPNDAIQTITGQNRSPLTLEEGIALITHYPDVLMKNNGFSLLGSRGSDRRVTALWISGGKPKLGWCWAGNPHTWLGSASCRYRAGAESGGQA
ncbi:DUF5701 family protein [Paenibacillus sp. GCM10012303]|uniref:DUF5701 family protein n=1 Tax=Paenibacillus sp. GCM10012303 TaxID=3317340 RepID=UPI00360B3C9D